MNPEAHRYFLPSLETNFTHIALCWRHLTLGKAPTFLTDNRLNLLPSMYEDNRTICTLYASTTKHYKDTSTSPWSFTPAKNSWASTRQQVISEYTADLAIASTQTSCLKPHALLTHYPVLHAHRADKWHDVIFVDHWYSVSVCPAMPSRQSLLWNSQYSTSEQYKIDKSIFKKTFCSRWKLRSL